MGQSRNENILENILGASNPLGEPQSREEALLMQLLEKLDVTVVKWAGITTTALTDGDSTNPITVDGKSYTAVAGDMVSYESKEFVFSGTIWQEFGDLSGILRIIGNTYDSTTTYEVGDYTIYESKLYICTTAITTPEVWNGLHWQQTSIIAALKTLQTAIGNKMDNTNPTGTGNLTMSGDVVINGNVSLSSKVQSYDAAIGKILTGTLVTGQTSVEIEDESITTGKMYDIFTDVYGLEPTNVAISTGRITLTFDAQGANITVKVKVI